MDGSAAMVEDATIDDSGAMVDPGVTMTVDIILCGEMEGQYPPLSFSKALLSLLGLIGSRIFFEKSHHVDKIQNTSSGLSKLLERKKCDNQKLLKSMQRLAFAKCFFLEFKPWLRDFNVIESVVDNFENTSYQSLSWTNMTYFQKLSSSFQLDLFFKLKKLARMCDLHKDISETLNQELNREIAKISIGLFEFKRGEWSRPPLDHVYSYFDGSKIHSRERRYAMEYFNNIVDTYQQNKEIHKNVAVLWELNKKFLIQFTSGKNRIFDDARTFGEYCERKTSSQKTSKQNNQNKIDERLYLEKQRRRYSAMGHLHFELELLKSIMRQNGHS